MKNYEILESISEHKLRIYGNTVEDLFKNALMAMFHSLDPEYQRDSEISLHQISLSAFDRDLLLIDFLTEALALSDIFYEAYYHVEIDLLTEQTIEAIVHGKKLKRGLEIKAVTHHGVAIQHVSDHFVVEIIFDI